MQDKGSISLLLLLFIVPIFIISRYYLPFIADSTYDLVKYLFDDFYKSLNEIKSKDNISDGTKIHELFKKFRAFMDEAHLFFVRYYYYNLGDIVYTLPVKLIYALFSTDREIIFQRTETLATHIAKRNYTLIISTLLTLSSDLDKILEKLSIKLNFKEKAKNRFSKMLLRAVFAVIKPLVGTYIALMLGIFLNFYPKIIFSFL